jgi:hypothetical protein
LVSTDDANLLGGNIDTIEKNTQTLIDTSKEVGLEVNTEKTKYTVTYGFKAGTCASARQSFARHILMVAQNTPLLYVLMEPLETYPW